MNLQNFLGELKRRHVYRVAIAYGVVAWLLIQVATQVFPFFEVSNFVVRVVVAASVLGFPVALIIAWAFEMTPEGLKRADDVAPDDYIPRWSTRKFAALVVSGTFRSLPRLWDRFAEKPRRQGRATSPPCAPAKRRTLLESFPQLN